MELSEQELLSIIGMLVYREGGRVKIHPDDIAELPNDLGLAVNVEPDDNDNGVLVLEVVKGTEYV